MEQKSKNSICYIIVLDFPNSWGPETRARAHGRGAWALAHMAPGSWPMATAMAHGLVTPTNLRTSLRPIYKANPEMR